MEGYEQQNPGRDQPRRYREVLRDYSGLYISFVIAIVSLLISRLHQSLDPLVLSIILAMLLSNILTKRDFLSKGVNIMLRLFLPLGIILYGSQLRLRDGLDFTRWVILLTVFIATFFITILISKALGLSKRLCILLASGLSICGASAIVIISPLIKAKKEETSISLIVVMIIGLTALIFYPFLYHLSGLNTKEFALIAGTTIPMLGQVKVTSLQVAGMEGLSEALRYKLIRVSLLLFLVFGVTILFRQERRVFPLPWFMVLTRVPKKSKDFLGTFWSVSHKRSEECDIDGCPAKMVFKTGKTYKTIRFHRDNKENKRYYEIVASPVFDQGNNVIYAMRF